MNASIPEFGRAVPGRSYELRPGAYGILRDAVGRVAVVVTSLGGFLPGGAQESGESPEQALQREALEECGLEVEVEARVGVADELVFSQAEGRSFRKRGTFFRARCCQNQTVRHAEPGHRLTWLPAPEAIASLLHESHRWAVRASIAEPGAATNGGPATHCGNSDAGGGPASVS